MFTGIIEEIGRVRNVDKSGSGVTLTLECSQVLEGTKVGDSIAIDGACQTVTSIGKDYFSVFASKITCSITTLGAIKTGKKVTLERAMAVGSRFGGHLVQGHVDGKGSIKRVFKDENGIEFEISVDNEVAKYLVEKGSVAVDGISLTVVSLTADGFIIYIIPETIAKTTLPDKKMGQEVNVETDLLAKYVEKIILSKNGQTKDALLKNKLLDEGFI